MAGVAIGQVNYTPVSHAAWTLVGTTTTIHLGDAGVRTMSTACAAELPSSRMCTSDEVLNSQDIFPFSSTDAAWVRPSFQPVGAAVTSSASFLKIIEVIDASGMSSSQTGSASAGSTFMTCLGWSCASAPYSGLVVTPAGAFVTNACNVPRPVACCALIQVPEPSQNSGLAMGIAALGLLNRSRRS